MDVLLTGGGGFAMAVLAAPALPGAGVGYFAWASRNPAMFRPASTPLPR
ncbi:hypothetical protein [Microbispora sp. H10670]|nr:hypothetical protein [Microbispora sp. H10670]